MSNLIDVREHHCAVGAEERREVQVDIGAVDVVRATTLDQRGRQARDCCHQKGSSARPTAIGLEKQSNRAAPCTS